MRLFILKLLQLLLRKQVSELLIHLSTLTGTVSRIALNRVRYVAIFEGVPIQSAEPAKTAGAMSSLRWSYVLIPIGVVAAAGAGVGGALLVKHRKENADEEDTE